MNIPDILQFSDSSSFFREFYATSRRRGSSGSYRALARRLKWPVSYLSDLIHKRRRLTVHRAVEFARFAKWDALRADRLIYFALSESEDAEIAAFFARKLAQEQNFTSMTLPGFGDGKPPAFAEVADRALYSSLAAMTVFEVISWAHGRVTRKDIQALLPTVEEVQVDEKLEAVLDLLAGLGCIRKAGKQFEALKDVLHYAPPRDEQPPSMVQWLHHAVKLRELRRSGMWVSGLVVLPRHRYEEALQRILAVKNWISAASKEAASVRGDKLPFQMNLHLVSLFDLAKFGLKTIGDAPPLAEQKMDDSWLEAR